MRSLKVIDHEGLVDYRLKHKTATNVAIFGGNMTDTNMFKSKTKTFGEEIIVDMPNNHWEGSEGHAKLWKEIRELQNKLKSEPTNAAQAPATATLEQLVQKYFIDITRRAQESPDLTGMIATEVVDFDFPETVNVKDLLDYIGTMRTISGTGDSVPLIQQNLGNVDTVTMSILAMGWKDSLKNLLYNSIHDMQKVSRAVVAAHTDARNARTVGVIVGATYVATQQQAADTTSGATFDALMYNTLRKGVKKLKGLKDPKTKRTIPTPSISLLCNSANAWDIERVVRGQLGSGNGTNAGMNMTSLPIDTIIEYDQGMTNGFTYGKETLSFPGVTAGKCYLFVPFQKFIVATKRPLTMETGRGDTLQLSTEERAWYMVQGEYYKDFLGSSYPGASTTSEGYIIEVTLPADA
jgi:hypothetical protein